MRKEVPRIGTTALETLNFYSLRAYTTKGDDLRAATP
jgi:hypothetical protein